MENRIWFIWTGKWRECDEMEEKWKHNEWSTNIVIIAKLYQMRIAFKCIG